MIFFIFYDSLRILAHFVNKKIKLICFYLSHCFFFHSFRTSTGATSKMLSWFCYIAQIFNVCNGAISFLLKLWGKSTFRV